MQSFTLPTLQGRSAVIARISAFLALLPNGKAWNVEVKEAKSRRSDRQNRYLWGVCYPAIKEHLQGWESEDIHEYCLGECFGWERMEGLSRPRMKPMKRSSKLSTTEFADYVAWIQRDMAQRGIYVPDPNEGEQ